MLFINNSKLLPVKALVRVVVAVEIFFVVRNMEASDRDHAAVRMRFVGSGVKPCPYNKSGIDYVFCRGILFLLHYIQVA